MVLGSRSEGGRWWVGGQKGEGVSQEAYGVRLPKLKVWANSGTMHPNIRMHSPLWLVKNFNFRKYDKSQFIVIYATSV